ncbi:MAG: helix-turn-helix transcriptional regulator [Clostridia bacterium]|nr:helix-turn-helix transcriptional regulator [Clostridia bacterium]
MRKITISEKIKAYRAKNNLTQEAFGALLGLSPQAVSKWERTECYPDITILPDLADLFGCSVNDFFEDKEYRE